MNVSVAGVTGIMPGNSPRIQHPCLWICFCDVGGCNSEACPPVVLKMQPLRMPALLTNISILPKPATAVFWIHVGRDIPKYRFLQVLTAVSQELNIGTVVDAPKRDIFLCQR